MSEPPMPDDSPPPPAQSGSSASTRASRLGFQILGFVIGAVLLAGCVWFVLKDDAVDPWERLRAASPWDIAGLLACSLTSLFLNATSFWLAIRPIRNLGFWNLQRLNVVANALNYAPLRAGLIMRVAYHLRIDRLAVLQIGAWFACIAIILLSVSGVLFGAMLIRPRMDWAFLGLAICGLGVVGALIRVVSTWSVIEKHGRGAHVILQAKGIIWGLIGLRLLDIACFTGRLYFATRIVGMTLPEREASYLLMLALVALLAGLIPVRIGFREALVALAAAKLGAPTVSEAEFALLALVESAGEALVYVPLGAWGLVWYAKTWAGRGRVT